MVNKDTALLVTGSGGFIGKNLVAHLQTLGYTNILCYEKDTNPALLAQWAAGCGFVFHLAGINRPKSTHEFYSGNFGLTEQLLDALEKAGNNCPVLITSSAQATLDNDYGKSKAQAEEAVFAHEKKTGAPALVYRLPGVFGKWCRPAYNSVVATFCYNIANGLPIEVRDPNYALPLIYIDDVVHNFIDALEGRGIRDMSIPGHCHGGPVYTVTLGHIATLLQSFKDSRATLDIANMADPFTKKLYSTYLSYLPKDAFSYPLNMHCDDRGSFTEIFRTVDRGQVSVNISKPGITKGNHWHHTKNEKFIVVNGKGAIRFRSPFNDEIIEYFVSGDKIEVVDIPTGYTHSIENMGDTDMVTIMWCNECFNPDTPDTIFLPVKQ
ncbi:MAG: NAD-dependent epimerase/dehydratase family protein [Oscillospiraceae bacterium]|nr:NAD-dependent epimerase/dehydratase family protein [Oscillospiraceae bacterium]